MKKVLFLFLAMLLALALALPMASVAAHTEGSPQTNTLWAGQNIDVGTVSVWNDGTSLYVKYETSGDWVMTETHLHVATSLDGIPQKKGNPPPGQFDYSMDHAPPVTAYTYTIPLGGWTAGTELYIAAHAVVEKVIVIEEAPYYAASVVSYSQGLTKGGAPVRWQRSTPEQGLAFESGQSEFNFFSLGFGGEIVVEFDCPICNGEGNDVQIIEDTWGTYPLETADVYVSQDGVNWTFLGAADNTNNVGIHTISEFDLDGVMDCVRYIKVVDTTDPAVHGSNADGYDLNAVVSLQDCVEVLEETAWAGEDDFPGKNWATYFEYTVQ